MSPDDDRTVTGGPRSDEATVVGGRIGVPTGSDESLEGRDDAVVDLPPIGPYRPLRELGRGAQATVYLAADTRLDRLVALKVLRYYALSSDPDLARFKREVEATSKLDHPGICAVYDAGVEGGAAYIAMRYVPGTTLGKRIEAARQATGIEPSESPSSTTTNSFDLPAANRSRLARLIEVFERAALALHAAHEGGVIHRDVKPQNIMITPTGEPVVLDFGLAGDISDDSKSLTQTGDVFGTPAYMSPEQASGRHALIDGRTDVWSLGVSLYECLTLRRPFDAPTRELLFDAILRREPTDPRRFNSAVSADLKTVLETALEKDAHRRYRSALALADDLRRVRSQEPILARPVGPIGRSVRFCRRRPATAALMFFGVVALAAAATSLAIFAGTRSAVREQKERAALAAFTAHLESGFFEESHGSAERALAEFDAAISIRPESEEAIAGKVLASKRLGAKAPEICRLLESKRGVVERSPGLARFYADALRRSGRTAEATTMEAKIGPAVRPIDHFLLGLSSMEKAHVSGVDDLYAEACEHYRAAVLASRTAQALFHYELLHALGHRDLDKDEALAAVAAVESLWPENLLTAYWAAYVLTDHDPERAIVLAKRSEKAMQSPTACARLVAASLLALGRKDEARRELEAAVKIEPNNAFLLVELAALDQEDGRLQEAFESVKRAIDRGNVVWSTWNRLGTLAEALGDWKTAELALRRAAQTMPTSPLPVFNLGNVLSSQGRSEEAEKHFRRALEIEPKHSGSMQNLATILAQRGDVKGAAEFLDRRLALEPLALNALHAKAAMYVNAGDAESALAAAERLLDVAKDFPPGHDVKARALLRLGRYEEALESTTTAIRLDPKGNFRLRSLADDCEKGLDNDARATAWFEKRSEIVDWEEGVRWAETAALRGRHRTAAALYRALATHPARNPAHDLRYTLARCEARAGAGEGAEAKKLAADDRAAHRAAARSILATLLAEMEQALDEERIDPERIADALDRWRTDPAFVAVRDLDSLAAYPRVESRAWAELWSDIARLRRAVE